MKNQSKNLPIAVGNFKQVQIYAYSDGSVVAIPKRGHSRISKPTKMRGRFPPVNCNESMTNAALRKTLNRSFERLFELDLEDEKCWFVTLTISKEKHNSYDKICNRYSHFIGLLRERVKDFYVGAVRFIEVQEKGFFHIHCILVFDRENIKLTWRDCYKMWGWGYVNIKTVTDRFGLIDYLTNIKHSAGNWQGNKFTRYPKRARVIYIDPNLPKSKSEYVYMSPEEYSALLQDSQCAHLKTHKYYDRNTKRVCSRIDKIVFVRRPKNKKKEVK